MTEQLIPLHHVKAEYKDFIGVYPNFLNADICDNLISEYKDKLEISASTSRVWKSDTQFKETGKLGLSSVRQSHFERRRRSFRLFEKLC